MEDDEGRDVDDNGPPESMPELLGDQAAGQDFSCPSKRMVAAVERLKWAAAAGAAA